MDTAALWGRVVFGVASLAFSSLDRREARGVIEFALQSGAGLVDTARAYGRTDDSSFGEHIVGDAIRGREVIVGTKGGHSLVREGTWDTDISPTRLRSDVSESLRALKLECIPIYYLHRVDLAQEPLEDAILTLSELQREGKIDLIGVSNVTTDDLDCAHAVAKLGAVQNRHSALRRDSADVLTWCERHAIPFFAYSPLHGSAALQSPRLSALAAEREVSVQCILLAALLNSSPALSVVTGATRHESIIDSLAAEALTWDSSFAEAYTFAVNADFAG